MRKCSLIRIHISREGVSLNGFGLDFSEMGHLPKQFARVFAKCKELPITRKHLYDLVHNAFEEVWVSQVVQARYLSGLKRPFAQSEPSSRVHGRTTISAQCPVARPLFSPSSA
ncbi:MAG: hypothetical protein P0111_07980 [Nitrospira sp.]|nr:hypothetical protein [Nitrospira sp.]